MKGDQPKQSTPNPQQAYASLLRQFAVEEIAADAMEPQTQSDIRRAAPRVLIVDDKPELLKSLAELLRAERYQVEEALGGQAAIDALQLHDYDLVLLDLIMPKIGGMDVLRFLESRGTNQNRLEHSPKVIVVSGDSSFTGVKQALTNGAFDFVRKPYEPAELFSIMDKALRHRQLERSHDDMELRLRDSEALHRFIVNSSPDLVYMLDRHGCIRFLNERVESLLGFEKDELLGRHYSSIVYPDDLEMARYLINERRTGERASNNIEVRLQRKPGTGARPTVEQSVWVELTAMGVYRDQSERTRDGFIGTYGTARDITERKEAEQVINFQAYHDLLTHLPNRALLKDRLSLAIAQAKRNRRRLAVMFLDLDRFKLVNDTLGHTMGDRLLKAVAHRLQGCLRRGDTLARFGGDEFTLLLPEIRTRDDVAVIAGKILDKLTTPFIIDGHELFVGASIGIAMYPEAGDTVESLVQSSDIAMYHVKSRAKNGFQFYADEMNHQFSTRLSLERELRNGLARNELRVYYQPQVDLNSGRVAGVEALVRWQHPRMGLIPPAEFLPVAVETGLIIQLDEAVQSMAFREVAEWHRLGLGPIHLSVNMSVYQLEQDRFLDSFLYSLKQSGLDPNLVKLEITENTIMQDMEVIIPKLRALREHGIHIAIDDFGTGYSSLSYLQHFPVNTLKIDRSFVGDIRAEQGDASIINAIVAMARGLQLDLIAEGVENRVQLKYLRSQGCTEVQGFIFSHALPGAEIKPLLRSNPYSALLQQSIDGESKVISQPA